MKTISITNFTNNHQSLVKSVQLTVEVIWIITAISKTSTLMMTLNIIVNKNWRNKIMTAWNRRKCLWCLIVNWTKRIKKVSLAWRKMIKMIRLKTRHTILIKLQLNRKQQRSRNFIIVSMKVQAIKNASVYFLMNRTAVDVKILHKIVWHRTLHKKVHYLKILSESQKSIWTWIFT